MSNLQPRPGMDMNAAQRNIINLLKTIFCSSVFISVWVFNVWSEITLLPVWPRDAKRLDTPGPFNNNKNLHGQIMVQPTPYPAKDTDDM